MNMYGLAYKLVDFPEISVMDDLVDGRFCLAYCRLSLRFSLVSFKVSLFILTLSAFSRQSTSEIEMSAASFMESTKYFWYSSMSEAF